MPATFATMLPGQRDRWLAWANSHDWGAAPARWSDEDPFTMQAECIGFDRNDHPIIEVEYFTNPAELRAWAGY